MAERFSPATLLQSRDLNTLSNLNTRDPRSQAFKRAAAVLLSSTAPQRAQVETLGYLTGNRVVTWDEPVGVLPTQIQWRLNAEIDYVLDLDSNPANAMVIMLGTYIKPQISTLTVEQVDEYIRQSVTGIVAKAQNLQISSEPQEVA